MVLLTILVIVLLERAAAYHRHYKHAQQVDADLQQHVDVLLAEAGQELNGVAAFLDMETAGQDITAF
jgi:hypothetical protein